MDKLRQFNGDKGTKQELLDYLVGFFESKIILRAMDKENTDSLVDAIKELESGFEQLDLDFRPHLKENELSKNESR